MYKEICIKYMYIRPVFMSFCLLVGASPRNQEKKEKWKIKKQEGIWNNPKGFNLSMQGTSCWRLFGQMDT